MKAPARLSSHINDQTIVKGIVGRTISHYHIVSQLGGSMRVVYEAEDFKLHRHVTVRFGPRHLVKPSLFTRLHSVFHTDEVGIVLAYLFPDVPVRL